jgi:mono/diheme cytochrome c family protein
MRIWIVALFALVASRASADDKATVLANEQAAYAKAKPVFEKYCASCHTKDGKQTSAKKLDHFDMTSYPFGGHHTATLGPTIRKVLGIGGGKATMPKGKPGSVKGDELAAIEAWTKAWDAAQAGGGHADAAQPKRYEIAITTSGFEPGSIQVPAKTPVTLVFTRKTDQTCTKTIVVTLDEGKTIERELPLDKPVEIAATFPKPGTLGYACSMQMNKGTIVVQ